MRQLIPGDSLVVYNSLLKIENQDREQKVELAIGNIRFYYFSFE